MSHHDVVVVGGGLVGTATAALLGGSGLEVALVEARLPEFDLSDGQIDLRVSALSRSSRSLLESIGAWQHVDPVALAPYRDMRVWDAGVPPDSADVVHFDCAEIGEPELGFIVENRRISAALYRRLEELDTVVINAPARVTAIDTDDERVSVTLDDGRRLRATLVVGADGAGSPTRELAGIETRGWSYEQQAVVTHVSTRRPHAETAFQRFLPAGPIALLPLYDGRCSIVWSTSPQEAEALLQLDDAEFCRAVTVASDAVLGDVVAADRRAAFPLQLRYAVAYTRPRIVLVGDAAHAVHPLAGQGVNLGFSDVRALGGVLSTADRLALGDLGLLRRYERQRKSENLAMMGALEALHRLFGRDSEIVGRARQVGMSLFNRMTPLKGAVMRRAMGL